MRPLPLLSRPARLGSVQRSDKAPTSVVVSRGRAASTRAMNANYLRRYQEWQGWAKRYARQIGVVRFSAGLTSDTVMRVLPRVERLNDRGEWDEVEDDARLVGIIEEYRNARQEYSELLRAHAWHYAVAGECFQVMRDLPTGIEWSIWSSGCMEWDKPMPGQVTVKETPDGKISDETAFVVPREYVQRFWIPDEEWSAYATSPMAASIEDLHRLRSLSRNAWNTADSALAMNGVAWWPDDDWLEAPPMDEEDASDVATPSSTVEDNYYELARLRLDESDDVVAVAPHFAHGKKEAGPPQWIKFGDPLDPNGIAYRAEAREDFARATNLPAALVSGGGPGEGNHWTDWLVDDKFFDQAIGPTCNRIFHVDLTTTFLAPRLELAGMDPRRYRLGYDPTPVIVAADKSDRALKAYALGLIGSESAREAGGWDETDAPTAEDLTALLDILARGRELVPGAVTPDLPGATPAGPAQSPLGPPQQPVPLALAGSARQVGAVNGFPTAARTERLLRQLTSMKANLGRKLLAGAEVAYREALRRVGVKVATRARSRGASKSTQAAALAAVEQCGPYGALLGALGLTESDLLAGSFVTFQDQAAAWVADYRKKQRAALEAAGFDPDELMNGEDNDRVDETVLFLAAALLALARQRVLSGAPGEVIGGLPALPGEVTGFVPARLVTSSLRILEGTARPVHGSTADRLPEAALIPDMTTIEEGIAGYLAGEDVVQWTWVHGFYGDPTTVFEPHEDLGASGFTTADPDTDPDLAVDDRGGWLDVDYYAPGDHEGCTCEWVPNAG